MSSASEKRKSGNASRTRAVNAPSVAASEITRPDKVGQLPLTRCQVAPTQYVEVEYRERGSRKLFFEQVVAIALPAFDGIARKLCRQLLDSGIVTDDEQAIGGVANGPDRLEDFAPAGAEERIHIFAAWRTFQPSDAQRHRLHHAPRGR